MPTYHARGPATGSEIWLASGEGTEGLAMLIHGIMGGYPANWAERRAARRKFMVDAATRVQADLVSAAIAEERFSYAAADSRVVDRLRADRATRDAGGPWPRSAGVPLVIVHPDTKSAWRRPQGQVLALDWRDETVFLWGLKHLGWLVEFGRLDCPSWIQEPYL